jgi:protein-tyrosine phosphatase
MNRILFLCTGNYYRSRLAEELFNHHAERTGLAWRAGSRGLAIELGKDNEGPLSSHVLRFLEQSGVCVGGSERYPRQCTLEELAAATLVVAVKEAEHRPLLRDRFPGWEARVTYWHVHDIDVDAPGKALPEIAVQVEALVTRLLDGMA